MSAMRERVMRAAPLVLLATAALTLLWEVVVGGKAMVPADILTRYEPWHHVFGDQPVQNHYLADVILSFHPYKVYIASVLRSGHFPLWLSQIGLGYPIIATQESYFTWALPLYTLLDFWTARSLELLGTLLLAGGFAYAYLRHLQLGRAAASLGAVVAMLGFQFTQNLLTGHMTGPLLWLPVILLLLDRSRTHNSLRLRVVAGGVTGIGLLAGSLQGMIYLLCMVALDIAWHAWGVGGTGRRREVLTAFAGEFLAVVGVGMLIASPRLLPSLELLANSERALETSMGEWVRATGRRVAAIPLLLIGTISPAALGNPGTLDATKVLGNLGIRGTITGQEFKAYIGILPLGCLLWSVRNLRRNETVRRFLVLFVAPVLLAALTPLTFILYFPRGLVMAVLPMAVLAALGAESLLRQDAATLRRIAAQWGWAWLMIIAIGTATTLAIRARQVPLSARAREVVAARLDQPDADSAERAWQLAKADRFVEALSFPSSTVFRPALWALGGLAVLAMLARGQRGAAVGFAIGMTTADLIVTAREFLPVVERGSVYPELPVAGFLQRTTRGARVVATPARDAGRPFLPPNTLLHYGLRDVRLYESLFPTIGLSRSPELYDAIGVSYVVTPKEASVASATLVYDDEVRVFHRTTALPRAYAVFQSRQVASDSAAAAMIRSRTVDLRTTVLTAEPTTPAVREECGIPEVTLREEAPERIVVTASLDCAGWVVLSDRWYPGWQAVVNGHREPIVRANLGLRAVRVPADRSTLEFVYRPQSVRVGLALALAGLLLVAVALIPFAWLPGQARAS